MVPGAVEIGGVTEGSADNGPRQVHASAVVAPMMTADGVSQSHPRAIKRPAINSRLPSPINTTSVSDCGAIDAITRSTASRSDPLSTTNPGETPRCVTGMPARAGAAIAVVTPGTTSN